MHTLIIGNKTYKVHRLDFKDMLLNRLKLSAEEVFDLLSFKPLSHSLGEVKLIKE